MSEEIIDKAFDPFFTTKPTGAGTAAMTLIREPQSIDLLLTDVVMPGMNGRALSDEARRHRPGLKVLYMTGYSRNAIVHQGRLDPGVSLIQKPFSEAALASRVHAILSGLERAG